MNKKEIIRKIRLAANSSLYKLNNSGLFYEKSDLTIINRKYYSSEYIILKSIDDFKMHVENLQKVSFSWGIRNLMPNQIYFVAYEGIVLISDIVKSNIKCGLILIDSEDNIFVKKEATRMHSKPFSNWKDLVDVLNKKSFDCRVNMNVHFERNETNLSEIMDTIDLLR